MDTPISYGNFSIFYLAGLACSPLFVLEVHISSVKDVTVMYQTWRMSLWLDLGWSTYVHDLVVFS